MIIRGSKQCNNYYRNIGKFIATDSKLFLIEIFKKLEVTQARASELDTSEHFQTPVYKENTFFDLQDAFWLI